jgi:hypothetical protein
MRTHKWIIILISTSYIRFRMCQYFISCLVLDTRWWQDVEIALDATIYGRSLPPRSSQHPMGVRSRHCQLLVAVTFAFVKGDPLWEQQATPTKRHRHVNFGSRTVPAKAGTEVRQTRRSYEKTASGCPKSSRSGSTPRPGKAGGGIWPFRVLAPRCGAGSTVM